MLKAPADLMPSAQIQQEGERVDMCSSAQKDCNLFAAEG